MNEGVFITVLNMSFTGSIVALIVMAARLFMKKIPGRYSYLLWIAVGIRLLCPFIWETDFSLLPVKPEPVNSGIVYEEEPVVDSGVFFLDDTVNHALEQVQSQADVSYSVNPIQIWLAAGTTLWAAGCAVFIFINFVMYTRLKKRLKTAVLVKRGEDQDRNKRETGPYVYETEAITSPIAAGFLKPAIYVPFGMEREDLEYVILHEKAHIKRKDHLVKLVGFLALAVHWFNPIVWFSYFLMCEDMEKACDEKVLDMSEDDSRARYSAVLYRFAVKQNKVFLPLAFGESHTKARIKNILNYKKSAPWAGGLITIAVLLAGCALSTNPKEATEAISIIGGADGPTSIFLAGKLSGDAEGISFQPVDMETLSNAVLDKERKTISLDYASQVQGLLIFHGPWGIFVYEKNHEKWEMAHSIDMKKVDDSYMAEGMETKVIPSGTGIIIGNRNANGWDGSPYFYSFDTRTLYSDESLSQMLDTVFAVWENQENGIGPDQRISLLENEEIEELGYPYDYGYYQMEGNHLALLNSYTDRVLDLWFADVNQETQGITQAYLFHGDGEETVYQEDARQFLFTRDGYDYYVSLPARQLDFEEGLSKEETDALGRRELIRIDGQGRRAVLDQLVISGSLEGAETPVISAGSRLIYRGAKEASLEAFQGGSCLVSIDLDGGDRQAAGPDKIPGGVFQSLSLDTENNALYFEGWTAGGAFPRPVYKADTRLETIEKIGEIEGNLITVRNGNFYFLHKDETKLAVALARLEEGDGFYFYDKCGYSAKDYICERAYIEDGEIKATFVTRTEPRQKEEYEIPLEEKEKARGYLN